VEWVSDSNGYHNRVRQDEAWEYIQDRQPEILGATRKMLRAGFDGSLTSECFHGLCCPRFRSSTQRQLYSSAVSWAVYTIEYRKSLRKLLQSIAPGERIRVLEVCAGRGVLAKHMPDDQIEWLSTDGDPAEPHVIELDAMIAIETMQFDVVFVSWVPYESELDWELAVRCAQLGKPMIIVGESEGGCTGSHKFWGRVRDPNGESRWDTIKIDLPYTVEYADSVSSDFEDVPQWDGMHDYTSVVVPKGSG
jgi:hypothetical protein